jgi:hypothetical protein
MSAIISSVVSCKVRAESAGKFILLATALTTGCRFENEKINVETDADFCLHEKNRKIRAERRFQQHKHSR